jgi:cutinase
MSRFSNVSRSAWAASVVVAGLSVGAVGATAAAVPASAATAAATSCPAVNVVFARGTFEAAGLGSVGTPFASAVASDLPGLTVTDYAVNYAASANQSSAGPGATDMSNHIISMAAMCPSTRYVIGGYSQGASVTDIAIGIKTDLGTGTTIPTSLAPLVSAVVVFGNPLLATHNIVDVRSASPTRPSPRTAPPTDPSPTRSATPVTPSVATAATLPPTSSTRPTATPRAAPSSRPTRSRPDPSGRVPHAPGRRPGAHPRCSG